MPRFKLNPMVPGNYSFHCPDSRITLNLYRPMADFKSVTPAIVRGVTANRLIDLDQAITTKKHHIGLSDTDLKHVLLSEEPKSKVEADEEKEKVETQPEAPVAEASPEELATEDVVAEAPKRRSRSTKK